MNAQHTAGRLTLEYETDITGIEHDPENGCVGKVDVAHVYLRTVPGRTEANARRLVAAWNACEGIDTEDLEAGSVSLITKLHDDAAKRVLAQRGELLEALKLADCLLSGANMNRAVVESKVRAAIAKAEGGAA